MPSAGFPWHDPTAAHYVADEILCGGPLQERYPGYSRRAFLRFGAAATALTIPTILPAVAAPVAPMRTAPTHRGLALLRAIKSRRDEVNSYVLRGEDIPDDAAEFHGVDEAIEAIKNAPVRTMADIVDRLIVVGERCEPDCEVRQDEIAPHFDAILMALAGLKLEDCTLASGDPNSLI